jgi:hypothetical protein
MKGIEVVPFDHLGHKHVTGNTKDFGEQNSKILNPN